MATDEEYLDNLLKSITENETQFQAAEGNTMLGEGLASDEFTLPEGDLLSEDSMLAGGNLAFGDDMLSGNDMLSKGDVSFGNEIASGETTASSDDEEWMEDLKSLMGNNMIPDDDSDLDAAINNMDEVDIADLLGGMGDMDEELEEISGLLKHADDGGTADVDMLALLEGIEGSNENDKDSDPFASLLDGSLSDEVLKEDISEQPAEEDGSSKKKKKRAKKDKPERKRRLFGKKKRNGQTDEEGEAPTELVVPFEVAEAVIEQEKNAAGELVHEEPEIQDSIDEEPEKTVEEESASGIEQGEASETPEEDKSEQETIPVEKKPGFFARLLNALTQEEEDVENISEENKEILNELEEEDKKSSKKKEKKSKKGGKKKKGKEADGGDEEAQGSAKKGKKEKKPKKEKPPKEKEPTVKVLSRKNLLVLIAFCATIVGSIILLSFFLPEYADKKSARDAYNAGDYEEVYILLYDQNLNSGDLLIYNRAKTIRMIERRIESYENNLAIGRELEALDSLLKGVECYQTLTEADEFGVRREVDALYQQMCGILETNFGITAEEAMEINAYDSVTYTQRLYGAVYGTSFTGTKDGSDQGETEPEESDQPQEPQDILPEEEGIIGG